MIDPGSLSLGAAAAYALQKVAGPSLDAIGEAFRRYTDYRLHNVGRVIESGAQKLGDRMEEPGSVPPRVLSHILEEGSLSDDDLIVDYLGGVLASSKTPAGRDDRGATYTALVARLSSYQLRSHYIWYTEMRRLLLGREINFYDTDVAQGQAAIYMPFTTYDTAMQYGEGEDVDRLFAHSYHTLHAEGLLMMSRAGRTEHLQTAAPGAELPGLVVGPAVPGIELFLWGHGRGQLDQKDFLDPRHDMQLTTEVLIPTGSQAVADMRQKAAEAPADQQPTL